MTKATDKMEQARTWFGGLVGEAGAIDEAMHASVDIAYPLPEVQPLLIPLERMGALALIGKDYFALTDKMGRLKSGGSKGGSKAPPSDKSRAGKKGGAKRGRQKQEQAAARYGVTLKTWQEWQRDKKRKRLEAAAQQFEQEAAAIRAAHQEGEEE